jgi:WD40 repeat protein
MRNEIRLLALALAALALGAAQEPGPVVIDLKGSISDLYLSPDGRQALVQTSGSGRGGVSLLDIAEKRDESVLFFNGPHLPTIACTPDWTVGATATWAAPTAGLGARGTTSVHIVDPRTMKTVRTIATFTSGLYNLSMNLSPNGKYLAYGMGNVSNFGGTDGKPGYQAGGIKVFDTSSGKELLDISTNIDRALSVAISPDGKYLVGHVYEKNVPSVRVWELATAKLVATLEGHTDLVSGIRFSPDGQWLVSVGHDGAAILWNSAKGFAKAATLKKGPDVLYGKDFSPDGNLLAVAGKQGVITVWNIKTKKPAFTFHLPNQKPKDKAGNQTIGRLSFDKQGKVLAASTWDGLVLIWPLTAPTTTGTETKTEDK